MIAFLFALFLPSLSTSSIHYVSKSATDNNNLDGKSWSTAFPEVDYALNSASSGDEIWIAQGHYYPSDESTRDSCFHIINTVKIYGGFEGIDTETSINDRPYPLLDTILDGNIGDLTNHSDNCYHILSIGSEMADNTSFNGIIFTNGNADSIGDGTDFNQYGGVLSSYELANMNLYFENCTFVNNTAREGGALWFDDTLNVTINNCIFENNKAINGLYLGGYGGAIYSEYFNKIIIYNSKFLNNSAYYKGGSIYSDYGTYLHCYNCQFINNFIIYSGHGGAIFMTDRNSQSDGTYLYLYNNIFNNNYATWFGGALCLFNGVTPTIINTTFNNNTAGAYGGAIVNYDDIYYNGYSNNNFINNMALLNSSFNDIYNNSLPDFDVDTLIDTLTEYQNITQHLTELWETRSVTLAYNYYIEQSEYICYVDAQTSACTPSGCSGTDGTSWDTAYPDIQSCLDDIRDNKPSSVSQGEIWVAGGEYLPTESASWANSDTPDYYSFIMYDNTSLYGGFSGSETNRNSRNWLLFPSILSCAVSDETDTNCNNILLSAMNTIVDGFVFKDARFYENEDDGGRRRTRRRRRRRRRLGEYSLDGIGDVLSDTTGGRGGGIQSNGTNIIVSNCLFTNIVAYKGGGMYCMGKSDATDSKAYSPTVVNSIFAGNVAERAAGIAGDAHCHVDCYFCKFYNNIVSEKGATVYLDWTCNSTFNASKFHNNFAYESAGCIGADGSSSVYIDNVEFYNNSAQFESGCLYAGSHIGPANDYTIYNADFYNNYVLHDAGYENIWLWHGNTITYDESNNNYSYSNVINNIPTNPPATETDTSDTADNTNTDTSDDSGSTTSSSSAKSFFESFTALTWIIIAASMMFLLILIGILYVRCKEDKQKNDMKFMLLHDNPENDYNYNDDNNNNNNGDSTYFVGLKNGNEAPKKKRDSFGMNAL